MSAAVPNFADKTIWTGDNLDIMRGINSESIDLIYLVVRNVCNDWLIGTGAFPAMPGFWRQPLGSPAFHPSFQGCWSTRPALQLQS